jgi:hypothetical protein
MQKLIDALPVIGFATLAVLGIANILNMTGVC